MDEKIKKYAVVGTWAFSNFGGGEENSFDTYEEALVEAEQQAKERSKVIVVEALTVCEPDYSDVKIKTEQI